MILILAYIKIQLFELYILKGGKALRVKGFAYIRTADRYHTDEVKRQMEEIKVYCQEFGISDIEYFIYYGSGGNLPQNAEFARLKESIRRSTENHAVLVVHSIDRLTRNLREWQEVLLEIDQMGVACCAVQGGRFSYDLESQQKLTEIANSINSDYTDSCDEADESIPKLQILKPMDEGRTAMIMSDGKEYYLINDEISEMMALEFHADKCRVSDNGREIIMDEDDRQFPVAGIVNFMYPLVKKADFDK